MIVFEYLFGTPLYDESIRLRYKILKASLGIEFDIEQLSTEWQDFHLGIFDEDHNLLGCLVLSPKSDERLKMRQVAIDENYQHRGLGKQLVAYSEVFAKDKGFQILELNARMNAVPFYDKLDYNRVGEEFIEVGIPHFKMEKKLF